MKERSLAPDAVLTIALSTGQSAIASEPSAIASVSRCSTSLAGPQLRFSDGTATARATTPVGSLGADQLGRPGPAARQPCASTSVIDAGIVTNWPSPC